MTTSAFIEAVKRMVGLKPAMVEHLVAVAPNLNDAQRQDAHDRIVPLHDSILATNKAIVADIEQGEKEIQTFQHNELPQLKTTTEAGDRAAADALLNDSDTTSSPFLA